MIRCSATGCCETTDARAANHEHFSQKLREENNGYKGILNFDMTPLLSKPIDSTVDSTTELVTPEFEVGAREFTGQ